MCTTSHYWNHKDILSYLPDKITAYKILSEDMNSIFGCPMKYVFGENEPNAYPVGDIVKLTCCGNIMTADAGCLHCYRNILYAQVVSRNIGRLPIFRCEVNKKDILVINHYEVAVSKLNLIGKADD